MNHHRLLALCLSLAVAALPLQASASPASELVYALRNTLTHDFSVSGTGDLAVILDGSSLMTGEFQYRAVQNDGDLQANDNYDFRFDTAALAGGGMAGMPDMAGRLAFGTESLYRQSDEMSWGRLNNLMLDITRSDNPQLEKIAEGGAEILKFFADRYVSLDMAKIGEVLAGDNPEIAMMREQFAAIREGYADYGNFTADALEGLLATNMFDVGRDNGAYVITLTQRPERIALEKLAPLIRALGMPALDESDLIGQLQALNAEVESQWPLLKNMVDFKIRVTTDQSRISVFTVTLKTKPAGDPEDSAMALPMVGAVTMSMSGVIEDRASRISFPTEPVIDFTRIIEAFVAFSAQANSMMNSEAIEVEVSEDDDSVPPPPPAPTSSPVEAEAVPLQ